MLTSESFTLRPGCFTEKRICTPSSGWMRKTRREFDSSPPSTSRKSTPGAFLNWIATSVLRAVIALPVRM